MEKQKTIWLRLWPVVLLIFIAGCMPPPGQGGEGGQQGGGTNALLRMLGPMVFFFVIMWVLLIRPQQKKQREHDNLVKNLKAGDRVVASGMVGTVMTVKDNTLTLRSGDAKIEVLRHAVTEVFKDKPKGEQGN
jgi:preprotein translocase subunit YajC